MRVMKKVLYVITKGNWGGAQKYVFELATRIPKENFEAVVACGEGEILPSKLSEKNIRSVKIESLARDISVIKDFKVFFELIKIFKKEKPDIVHLNSSKVGGVGALAARVCGVRQIIFTVHGLPVNEPRPWYARAAIALASWITFILSKEVIMISQKELDQVKKWPFVKNKLRLIYNGIASPNFLEKSQALEKIAQTTGKNLDFFTGKTIVGTIAEFTRNKGLQYAISAVKEIPNILYIIIGTGEEEYSIKRQIKFLNLEDKVLLAGFIPDASKLLKAFDIFLLSSVKEGMPYVIMEAGFANLPVVATDVGGIKEIISNNESGIIVKSKDPEAINRAIISLIENTNQRNTLAEKLYTNASLNFTVDKTVGNTCLIYMK